MRPLKIWKYFTSVSVSLTRRSDHKQVCTPLVRLSSIAVKKQTERETDCLSLTLSAPTHLCFGICLCKINQKQSRLSVWLTPSWRSKLFTHISVKTTLLAASLPISYLGMIGMRTRSFFTYQNGWNHKDTRCNQIGEIYFAASFQMQQWDIHATKLS